MVDRKKTSKHADIGPSKTSGDSPAKPKDSRAGLMLRVRVTPEQRRVLMAGAEKSGLDVSSWLRAVGIERARELGFEMKVAGD